MWDFLKTTRMLAQKQPHIQRVRNSSLVERCAENVRTEHTTPKHRIPQGMVEEHCWRDEAVPEGAVECQEERMPE